MITVPLVAWLPQVSSFQTKSMWQGAVVGFIGVALLFLIVNRTIPKLKIQLNNEAILQISILSAALWNMLLLALIFGLQKVVGLIVIESWLNDKASEDNERNSLAIRMADGRQIAVVQIAGLVARRILCFTRVGQSLRAGDRFGLIRFGSRLDVYLPDGIELQVALGQTMVAGETVIASLGAQPPARAARME